MRDTAWGWLRRTATGLAAAGLLAGGLQTVGAGPAQASPIEPPNYSDCWSPVNISCVEDTGFDPGDDQASGSGHAGVVGAGVDLLVMARLGDSTYDCAQLIAGGLIITGGAAPQNVYAAATVTRSSTPDPEQPTALARAPIGAGANGTITIYPAFYTEPPENVFLYLPPHKGLSRLPTPAEMKAMTVLHEDAHLTGTLGVHTDEQSAEFNLRILDRCFGITKIN